MTDEVVVVVTRIGLALLIGAVIGTERGFHGRPAGLRTHSLVCVASALLMLITVFQSSWVTNVPFDAIRTDPTRMAQGIMTGIGFLGAGVIFKEGSTIRGLTTAASIWITSAIGILVGIGFYVSAGAGTVAALIVLSGFRVLEMHLPRTFFAHHTVRFRREDAVPEGDIRNLLKTFGFTIDNLSHRLGDGGETFEYRMIIWSRDRYSVERLSRHLRELPAVIEFRITPAGD